VRSNETNWNKWLFREAFRSNLIEVMADERWERLVEQQGVATLKPSRAMNLKIDADNPADREKLRRAVLDLVARRKMRKINNSAHSLGEKLFARRTCGKPNRNKETKSMNQTMTALLLCAASPNL
jgi:hypothetical protein